MKFDPIAPQAALLPRQHYGIDFYGIQKGKILVIVDLFTRETILTYLRNRTQENVARALLTNIIFQRDNITHRSSNIHSSILKHITNKNRRT
jgi:hypothetical protein